MNDFTRAMLRTIHHGDVWQHRSGRLYEVVTASNAHSDDADKFPPTVVYRCRLDGKVWSRPYAEWLRTMVRAY